MNQDTSANVYDFPAREYAPNGRWPSPDPAGMAAVDPTNPQSWNRYAYVNNNPLRFVDPTGMYLYDCVWSGNCSGLEGPGGGGGGYYGGQAGGVYIDGAPQTIFNTNGLGFNSIAGVLPPNCDYLTCTVNTTAGPVTFNVSRTYNTGYGEFGGCLLVTCWTFSPLPTDPSIYITCDYHCGLIVGQTGAGFTRYDAGPAEKTPAILVPGTSTPIEWQIIPNYPFDPNNPLHEDPIVFQQTISRETAYCIYAAASSFNSSGFPYSPVFFNSNTAASIVTSACGVSNAFGMPPTF